jgi:membrane protein DedA with SNARE-associated domain
MMELVHTLQAHALLLAILLPPAIRLAGHWLPEEPLMVAMGILATRGTSEQAVAIFAALWASHAATDNAVFCLGRIIAPHLERWPRIARRVRPVAARVATSRWMLAALIPARVLPLGRGAWLAGFGMAGVRWLTFAAVDALAVAVFLFVWCGLGWWVGPRIGAFLPVAKPAGLWLLLAVVASAAAVLAWRHRGGHLGTGNAK